MPITGTTLTTPVGELTVDLLTALVPTVEGAETSGDVADAFAAVGMAYTVGWTGAAALLADRGAALWATAKALRARAQQILAKFTTASAAGEGSIGYSTDQAKQLLARAAELERATDALNPPPVAAGATPARSRSTSVGVRY